MNVPPPNVPKAPEPSGGTIKPAAPGMALTLYDVFFDDDGLRAVWGIVLFLAIRKLLVYCVNPIAAVAFAVQPDPDGLISAGSTYVFEGAGAACLALTTWLMARMEQRPLAAYGFGREYPWRRFAAGMGWGVALISLLIGLLRAAGLLVFDVRLLTGPAVLRSAAIWLGAFVLVAVLEETYLRGYLQFALTRLMTPIYRRVFRMQHADRAGFWTAALILSFAFGITHNTNPGESPLGLVSAGIAGLLFCLSLWRTGSLWWAIGFHAAWDWGQSFLYGVADSGLIAQGRLFATHVVGRPVLSGGVTGPEGSILLLPVMGIGVAVVLLTLPRSNAGVAAASASPTAVD